MSVVEDWYAAKASISEMQTFADRSGFEWTLTHVFYANMGGFTLRAKGPNKYGGDAQPLIFLTCGALKYLCEKGLVERLPTIREDDINDKSKGDFFVKIIGVVQLTWLIVENIARAVQSLAISQLEIAVLAYAACAIFAYAFCLSKPKDIRIPTSIYVAEDVIRQIAEGDYKERLRKYYPDSLFRNHPDNRSMHPIANFNKSAEGSRFRVMGYNIDDYGFLITAILFGGIHCAAWNYEFPTLAEKLLWRSSSIVTTTIPVLFMAGVGIEHHVSNSEVKWILEKFEVLCMFVIYPIARLYLLVEVFRSLFFLPPSAFVGTWSGNIPHVT